MLTDKIGSFSSHSTYFILKAVVGTGFTIIAAAVSYVPVSKTFEKYKFVWNRNKTEHIAIRQKSESRTADGTESDDNVQTN